MKRQRTVRHEMQGVFVFVLLAMFALMSVLLVLFGAQMYRGIVDQAEQTGDQRILSSYVRSMVLAQDAADSVRLSSFEGGTALGLFETISDTEYVTWLYEYEGALWEQFTRADGAFIPDHGVEIAGIGAFEPVLSGDRLTVHMSMEDGTDVTVEAALRCAN